MFVAILSCLAVCSCDDGDEEIIISTCSVPQVPLDIEKEELVLVENKAELDRIFAGHVKELPQIDFLKSKLLLIHGSHRKQIKGIKLNVFQKINNYYDMSVTVETEDMDKDCYWTAAYLVPQSFNTPICLFLTIQSRYNLPAGKWFEFKN